MSIRGGAYNSVRIVIASMALMCASMAFAADAPKPATTAPSKETREKMAMLHESMATCLRSDKAFSECRTEMMKSCQSTLGQQGCTMMGEGMGMHGMHQGMKKPAASTPTDKK